MNVSEWLASSNDLNAKLYELAQLGESYHRSIEKDGTTTVYIPNLFDARMSWTFDAEGKLIDLL